MKLTKKEQKVIRGGIDKRPRNITCELFSGQLFTISGSCTSDIQVWNSCYAIYGSSLSCARCPGFNVCI